MEKFGSYFSLIVGSVGGFFAWLFGAINPLMIALTGLVIIDFITGIIKAYITKKLNSKTCSSGIVKKIMVFAVIGVAWIIGKVINDAVPILEIVVSFYIFNEGLSILENAGKFIKIPKKLLKALEQLKNEESEE